MNRVLGPEAIKANIQAAFVQAEGWAAGRVTDDDLAKFQGFTEPDGLLNLGASRAGLI